MWQPVPNHPKYEASEAGEVRRVFKHHTRLLAPRYEQGMRWGVSLLIGNSSQFQFYSLHWVIWAAFRGLPVPRLIAHLDGDETNCALSNLEGRKYAKLTPQAISLILNSPLPVADLATRLSVTPATIYRAMRLERTKE